ncbi:MAG TPA: MlaD family protein [Conexibacter sp.]|nr:MlaD family protein [Conexibacter sp.]
MISNVSASTKRALAGGLLALAVLLVLVLGTGASNDDGGTYRIRAIFDSASFLVPGEDVKVAGVKVGAIESLDVTRENKAAIVLRIDDPAFQDFKQDAFCTIRLQSLIGEKFVACIPTQPKSGNSEPPPSLHKITRGDGKGQYLLPVANTSAPVDLDMLNNIMRLPERQRFAIIINELGVGLAGNGRQLNQVIRRADPALYQLDRVLAILASQNRVLADLARDSDAALAPAARQSTAISDFIDKAGATAAATAARGDDLERNFERFPAFLTQLRPTMRRLGEFAAAGTPVMTDLRAAAPSINTLFEQLGPFATAALPTFRTLGNLADTGREALPAAEPIIRDIRGFAVEAKPFADVLSRGVVDLRRQHGIERLLDVILFTLGTTNGFDQVGHYLRTYLATVTPACLPYAVKQDFNCSATFNQLGNAASTTSTPPADALAGAAGSGTDGSASLVDEPAPAPTDTAEIGRPAGSGVLNYLLGGSGER